MRNTFRLNFDFGRNVRGRGQTTIEKPVRPCRFQILRLNRTVYTIHRFLSYFRFFIIIGPDWRPIPGWTGRISRSCPVFKTMARTRDKKNRSFLLHLLLLRKYLVGKINVSILLNLSLEFFWVFHHPVVLDIQGYGYVRRFVSNEEVWIHTIYVRFVFNFNCVHMFEIIFLHAFQ